jgi:hypothetical protein
MTQLLNVEEIDLPAGITLGEAVEILLKKKKEGSNCFIVFK